MKTKFTKAIALTFLTSLFASVSVGAEESNDKVSAIRQMRHRQMQEEQRVVRVIQQPIRHEERQRCSLIQQTRQRLRDIGKDKNGNNPLSEDLQSLSIDVGHDNLTVNSNDGTIENNINVQLVGNNEERCL